MSENQGLTQFLGIFGQFLTYLQNCFLHWNSKSECYHTQILCTKISIKFLLQDKKWSRLQNPNFVILQQKNVVAQEISSYVKIVCPPLTCVWKMFVPRGTNKLFVPRGQTKVWPTDRQTDRHSALYIWHRFILPLPPPFRMVKNYFFEVNQNEL